MSREDRLLFTFARQNFQEIHQQTVLDLCCQETINWPVVLHMAILHGVAPLIYTNLQRCSLQELDVPPKIVDQFKKSLMRNIIQKEQLTSNLVRALSFFGKRSFEVMVIKGGALDILVYDRSYYTMCGDIDLILNVRRQEITDRDFRTFRTYFHQAGIEYDFFEHHDVVMNGILPVDFHKIWNDAMKIKVDGHDVFVMSPEDMLISLCINSCRKRFFRLKALCDIAETINRYPDLNWEELIRKAKAYDCGNIVYAALLVTKTTVGCRLPGTVLDGLKVNPIRAKIIRALSRRMSLSAFSSLNSENGFGRKIDLSLLLPYATFHGYQILGRLAFYLLFNSDGQRRTLASPLRFLTEFSGRFIFQLN